MTEAVVETPLSEVEQKAAEKARQKQSGLLDFDVLIEAQDIEYVTVPTDEWQPGSYLRFGSTDAGTAFKFAAMIEKDTDIDASLRLMIQCLVDDDGNRRVTEKEQVDKLITALKKKNVVPVDRCLEAVMKLNKIKVPSRANLEAAAKEERELKNVSGEGVATTSPIESPATAA